jgi:acetyl esterase/lipase
MSKKLKSISFVVLVTLIFSLLIGILQNKESKTFASLSTIDSTNMPPTYKDIVYATVNNDNGEKKELKMNIFKPKDVTKATPVLIYIHGGGWGMGDYQCDDAPKDVNSVAQSQNSTIQNSGSIGEQVAVDSAYQVFKKVLNNGITFVSIDYRLSSEAAFPAQIFDVKGSIRYLRAHAKEYGIDPDKIAVAGNSAGGHLALELATTYDIKELEGEVGGNLDFSSTVMAVVDYYGPTDLLTMAPEMDTALQSPAEAAETHDSPQSAESKLLGFSEEGQGIAVLREIRDKNQMDSPYWEKVELAMMASPINYITSDDPPMFIVHGGSDVVVPIQQSLRLRDALNHAGVENIFMSYSRAPHGSQGEDVNHAAIAWIINKLLNENN